MASETYCAWTLPSSILSRARQHNCTILSKLGHFYYRKYLSAPNTHKPSISQNSVPLVAIFRQRIIASTNIGNYCTNNIKSCTQLEFYVSPLASSVVLQSYKYQKTILIYFCHVFYQKVFTNNHDNKYVVHGECKWPCKYFIKLLYASHKL